MSSLLHLLPWLRKPIRPGQATQTIAECRWLVIDCESSGLDPRKDRLLEIAYIGVDGSTIVFENSFEGILKQERASSAANILIHGISASRQLSGESPTAVMNQVAEALEARITVGFHADFDRELSRRALRRFTLRRLTGSWLDLADLAPVLRPDLAPQCKTLDQWLSALNIRVTRRHTAVGDALASAQLLITLLAPLPSDTSVRDLMRSAAAHRELALLKSPHH